MSDPILIVIPVFNDWESLAVLVQELDSVVGTEFGAVMGAEPVQARVLVVDDGSTKPLSEPLPEPSHLGAIEVLRLRRNLGHQRAIAVALAHVAEHVMCEAVVVMDGDGEDSPHDVPRLIAQIRATGSRQVVFAERTRRAEGLSFRVFYSVFRFAFWLLTGRGVRFGNFSAIPSALLPTFLVLSETWNHYACAVVRAQMPYGTLPTARRKRLRGVSKMNFVSLVTHGLSAVSVFGDVVATRALIAAAVLMGMGAVCIVSALWIRFFTELAIPGWTTNVIAFVIILIVQAVTACFVLTIFTLQSRSNVGFLPCRDYKLFVDHVTTLARKRNGTA